MLDLASNFNYLGPPKGTDEMLQANVASDMRRYAIQHGSSIKEAVSEYFDVPVDCTTHDTGATSLIFNLPKILPKRNSLITHPTFWEYEAAASRENNSTTHFNLSAEDGFRLPMAELSGAITNAPHNVYLCNPNNPTSILSDKEDLLALAETHQDSDVIVDETYLLFREDFEEITLSREACSLPNLHVISSLSKFFALPGIRLGLLFSDQKTIERYETVRIPYTNSPMAETVAPWMLKQTHYIDTARKAHAQARVGVTALLNNISVQFTVPSTSFVLCEVPAVSDQSAAEYLAEQGLAVRDGKEWGPAYDNFFRFSLGDADRNSLVASKLADYLKLAS